MVLVETGVEPRQKALPLGRDVLSLLSGTLKRVFIIVFIGYLTTEITMVRISNTINSNCLVEMEDEHFFGKPKAEQKPMLGDPKKEK